LYSIWELKGGKHFNRRGHCLLIWKLWSVEEAFKSEEDERPEGEGDADEGSAR